MDKSVCSTSQLMFNDCAKSTPYGVTGSVTVCEDCGRNWKTTLGAVPVTSIINNLDEYYENLRNKVSSEVVEAPKVLYLFSPSDRDIYDVSSSISVVAPACHDAPYHWHINHKHKGSMSVSPCQMIPCTGQYDGCKSENSLTQDIIKEEIDPIEYYNVDIKPDISSIPSASNESQHPVISSISKPNPAIKRPSEDSQIQMESCNRSLDYHQRIHVRKLSNLNKKVSKHSFVKVTDTDIAELKEDRHEQSTKKNTTWGVKLFKEWLEENLKANGISLSRDFEEYSKETLDDLLASFYPSIRTAKGTMFSKSSYNCFRAAIQRHLSGAPWNVPYQIVTDSAFKNSNEVLEGIVKELSREGKHKVKHHQPIEGEDLDQLKTTGTIGTHSPWALLRLVWLNIALNFARRGRENYRDMTKATFCVRLDYDGRKFIEHTFYEKKQKQSRIYEVKEDEYCPVRAFEMYLSLLNSELDCLWQKPNPRYVEQGYWYMQLPIGHNSLGKMMKDMCKDAKLSNVYTNHCTRVTASVMYGE